MFHSAGFFRGVPCPYFERGLCHRSHCHYKHRKPSSTKSSFKMPALKINPKLHTSNPSASFLAGKAADSAQQPEDPRPAKPVDPDKQESPGPTSSGDGGSGLVNTVPQVVDAIGQISNFFGSSTAVETTEVTSSEQQAGPSGHPQGEGQSCDSTRPPQSGVPSDVDPSEVKGQPPGEADGSGSISIGQLSRESIKRMAGAIAEQLADPVAESMEEGGHQQSDLPSYAPEKCLARQGGGKGSPVKLPASSARDVKERKDDISKLKDILVSEKEIFGGPLPDESDSDDDNFGTDSTQMAVDTGDAMDQSDAGALEDHGVDTMEDPSSSQAVTEAQMMAEFQKLTSLNEETLKESANTRKRNRPEERKETNVPVKKKRVAHPQAENVGMREPVRIDVKTKVVDANFTAMVKEGDLYMGKKRLANQPTSTVSKTVKKPRIPLDPRSKISSKLRQKYLDGYIDEHIKMHVPPEEAYTKAEQEEKELFTSSKGSRSAYMTKSYHALKQLRARVEQYLTQQRRESDKRVEKAKEISTEELIKKSSVKPLTSSRTISKKSKVSAEREKDKNRSRRGRWESLNAELQATYNQSKSLLNSTMKGKVSTSGKEQKLPKEKQKLPKPKGSSSTLPPVRPPPSLIDLKGLKTATFYSKKTTTTDAKKTRDCQTQTIADPQATKTTSDHQAKTIADHQVKKTTSDHQAKTTADHQAKKTTAYHQAKETATDHQTKASSDHQSKKMTADHHAKKTTADHQTKKTTADHQTKKISADHQAKKAFADHQAKKTSVDQATSDHQTKKISADHRTKKTSVDHQTKKTSVDHQTKNTSADHRTKKSAADHQAKEKHKGKSVGETKTKTVARPDVQQVKEKKKSKVGQPPSDEARGKSTKDKVHREGIINARGSKTAEKSLQEKLESKAKLTLSLTKVPKRLRFVYQSLDKFSSDEGDMDVSLKPTAGGVGSSPRVSQQLASSSTEANRRSPETRSRSVSVSSTSSLSPPVKKDLFHVDPTFDLFGSDTSDESVVIVSPPGLDVSPPTTARGGAVTKPLWEGQGVWPDSDHSPPQRYAVLSTDEESDDEERKRISFEDALASAPLLKTKRKTSKRLKTGKRDSNQTLAKQTSESHHQTPPHSHHAPKHKDTAKPSTPLSPLFDSNTFPTLRRVPGLKLAKVKLKRTSTGRSSSSASNSDANLSPTRSSIIAGSDEDDDCFIVEPREVRSGEFCRQLKACVDASRSGRLWSASLDDDSHQTVQAKSRTPTSSRSSEHSTTSKETVDGGPAGQIGSPAGQIGSPTGQIGRPAGQIGSPTGQINSPTGQHGSLQPCGPYINLTGMAKQRLKKLETSFLSSRKTSALASSKAKRVDSILKNLSPSTCADTIGRVKKASGNNPSFAILKKKTIPPLTCELFYSQMWSYVLTEEQLWENKYPRPTSEEGVASINLENEVVPKVEPVGPNAVRHECCRCRKPFIIYNSGQYQTVETCNYHYGRAFKYKEYGEGVVSKYSCCQEPSGSPGCQLAKLHVTVGEVLSQVSGYVSTSLWPSTGTPSDKPHPETVYALDCEMCYTTMGMQLARVSVVDMHLNVVYEKVVKPSHPIVDYNTRFSGLTAEDFVGVKTSLQDVQRDLLNLFSSETILLGHSLESDLKSLKLLHSRVVDTAIVFPHRLGPPYKKALKTLAKDILLKFIQDSGDEGHDSLEDSRTCMELMLWKVKGDLKAMCRRTSTSGK